MSKKLTEDILDDYLLDAFTELRPHIELHHPEYAEEMERAYTQIKGLIEDGWCAEQYYLDTIRELQKVLQAELQKKKTVTREWVEEKANKYFDCSINYNIVTDIFISMLKELGLEVEVGK